MAPIGTMRNAEHTLDGADRATDAGPDRASDDAADRTGNPVALMRPLLRPAYDTLGVARRHTRHQ